MSTDRGRRRTVESRKKSHARHTPGFPQLASGVRLDGSDEPTAVCVLACAEGNVQLNNTAVAILRLCDGSRNRDAIVAALMQGSHRNALAMEIIEFLDAAHARGWIVEVQEC